LGSQVLFIGYGSSVQEIQEFLESRDSIALFAQSTEDAIHILDEKPVKTVVLSIHELNDAAILKYINQYYPDKEVIISAGREYNEIIDVLSKGHFSVLKQPLKLKDLAEMIF
jgi:DNA-binding NtrC family response regulator